MAHDRRLAWLFAAQAGPLCVFLAFAAPTGEVPDEGAHAVRAESLWHGELLGHRRDVVDAKGRARTEAGVTAHLSLLLAASTFPPGPIAGKRLSREAAIGLADITWRDPPVFVSAPNTAVYFPALYLPAALGIAAARAAGQGPHAALIVARLVNATAFVLLGGVALAGARAGRRVMFVTLSLPMTLWLAGSLNPDGLLIAVSAIGAAALTRVAPRAPADGPARPSALACLCLGLIGATKPCYLPMTLALLAPFQMGDFALRRAWRWIGPLSAAALPGLLWSVAAAAMVAVPFVRPDYPPGPLWPGDPNRIFQSTDVGAQLAVLARGPWRIITLPLRSMWEQGRVHAATMIGVLGLRDLVLPIPLYAAWAAAGLAAVLADLGGGWRGEPMVAPAVTPLGALAIAGGVAASIWAIWILQYLSWTSVGSEVIEGVQGRYFLPLLPFLGIALSAARLGDPFRVGGPRLRCAAALAPIVLAGVSAPLVAWLVVRTYYPR